MRWRDASSRPVLAVLMLSALFAQPSDAQQRTEMVPAVLASMALNMIFGAMSQESPIVVTAHMPADFPAFLKPPADARPQGSVTYGPFHVTAFDFANGESALERYESLLIRAGATRTTDADPSGIKHGFAPSKSDAPAKGRGFCLDSRVIAVIRPDTVRSPNTLLLFWSASRAEEPSMRTTCDGGSATYMSPRDDTKFLELPPLPAPRGVRLTDGGGGGSDYERQWFARVDTSMTADSLLAHFARQFVKAGWTVGSPAANAQTGSVSLATTNDKGAWRGALTVVTTPDYRELIVRMARAQRF